MKNFKNNQSGKLSIEAIAWLALILILVTVGGIVTATTIAKKTNNYMTVLNKNNIDCGGGQGGYAQGTDIRPYDPKGIAITGPQPSVENGGNVPNTGTDDNQDGILDTPILVIKANNNITPFIPINDKSNNHYVDIDGNGTAEYICVMEY